VQKIGNIKILFVAGFGPIVRNRDASRKLYAETFDIPLKEDEGGYLHTEALKGVKHFALWPLSQAARSCFGKDSWPDDIPFRRLGSSLMLTVLKRQQRSLNREAIECFSRPRKNRGARL